MLNLGNVIDTIPEDKITLEDVLASEIEYLNAYQSVIDYENTLEIIDQVKSRASSECIAFANDLLGVSLESLELSHEKLNANRAELASEFSRMWNNFKKWLSRAWAKIKHYVLTINYDKSVRVGMNLDDLVHIAANCENLKRVVQKQWITIQYEGQAAEAEQLVRDISRAIKMYDGKPRKRPGDKYSVSYTYTVVGRKCIRQWLNVMHTTLQRFGEVVDVFKSAVIEKTNKSDGRPARAIKLVNRYLHSVGPKLIKTMKDFYLQAIKDIKDKKSYDEASGENKNNPDK